MHAFEKTFKNSCHDGSDVISDGKFIASKDTFKKCPSLLSIENDIFGGNLLAEILTPRLDSI